MRRYPQHNARSCAHGSADRRCRSHSRRTSRRRGSPHGDRSTSRYCTSATPQGSHRKVRHQVPRALAASGSAPANRLHRTSGTPPTCSTPRARSRAAPRCYTVRSRSAGHRKACHRTLAVARPRARGAFARSCRSSGMGSRLSNLKGRNPCGPCWSACSAWSRPRGRGMAGRTRCSSTQHRGASRRALWGRVRSKGPRRRTDSPAARRAGCTASRPGNHSSSAAHPGTWRP
mmetsp:Transcript_68502/g.189607  ORF Transcript_68502/g.189607 Transcript_68502/m.189607 type:complete len:231 (-) Transcript_68502:420-1112(-)